MNDNKIKQFFREFILKAFLLTITVMLLIAIYHIGKVISYNYMYEDMVKKTINNTIKPECIKKKPDPVLIDNRKLLLLRRHYQNHAVPPPDT